MRRVLAKSRGVRSFQAYQAIEASRESEMLRGKNVVLLGDPPSGWSISELKFILKTVVKVGDVEIGKVQPETQAVLFERGMPESTIRKIQNRGITVMPYEELLRAASVSSVDEINSELDAHVKARSQAQDLQALNSQEDTPEDDDQY